MHGDKYVLPTEKTEWIKLNIICETCFPAKNLDIDVILVVGTKFHLRDLLIMNHNVDYIHHQTINKKGVKCRAKAEHRLKKKKRNSAREITIPGFNGPPGTKSLSSQACPSPSQLLEN